MDKLLIRLNKDTFDGMSQNSPPIIEQFGITVHQVSFSSFEDGLFQIRSVILRHSMCKDIYKTRKIDSPENMISNHYLKVEFSVVRHI